MLSRVYFIKTRLMFNFMVVGLILKTKERKVHKSHNNRCHNRCLAVDPLRFFVLLVGSDGEAKELKELMEVSDVAVMNGENDD